MTILLGGHRGLGCTDHAFYGQHRDIAKLPVENTLESVAAAFKAGANFVEIDAVASADGEVFVLHNVVPSDHFFTPDKPPASLNTLPFAAFQHYPTGHDGRGQLARLDDMLDLIASHAPAHTPYALNLELKGVQGSGQPADTATLIQQVANVLKASRLASERVVFSSFALANVTGMANLMPQAQYGMLFKGLNQPAPMYTDQPDSPLHAYLDFNQSSVHWAMHTFEHQVTTSARLEFLHPETQTLHPHLLDTLFGEGWKINSWGLFEDPLAETLARLQNTVNIAQSHNASYGIITDYLTEISTLLTQTPHPFKAA